MIRTGRDMKRFIAECKRWLNTRAPVSLLWHFIIAGLTYFNFVRYLKPLNPNPIQYKSIAEIIHLTRSFVELNFNRISHKSMFTFQIPHRSWNASMCHSVRGFCLHINCIIVNHKVDRKKKIWKWKRRESSALYHITYLQISPWVSAQTIITYTSPMAQHIRHHHQYICGMIRNNVFRRLLYSMENMAAPKTLEFDVVHGE